MHLILMITPELWVAVALSVLVLASILYFLLEHHGRYDDPRLEGQGTKIIPRWMMAWTFWMEAPLVGLFVRARVAPNTITLLSLVTASVAGGAFALGRFGLAGWLVVVSGVFDQLDGRVARAMGCQTDGGGYLDSVLDRYCDVVLFLGLAWYYHAFPWVMITVLLALSGAMMVSYTKAIAEAHGVSPKIGFMQRHERYAALALAGILSPFTALYIEPGVTLPFYHLMVAVLVIMALLSHVGALQRFSVAYKLLTLKDARERVKE